MLWNEWTHLIRTACSKYIRRYPKAPPIKMEARGTKGVLVLIIVSSNIYVARNKYRFISWSKFKFFAIFKNWPISTFRQLNQRLLFILYILLIRLCSSFLLIFIVLPNILENLQSTSASFVLNSF